MSELKIGPGGEQIIEPSASSSKHDFDSMSASGGFGIENSKIGYVVPTTGPSSRRIKRWRSFSMGLETATTSSPRFDQEPFEGMSLRLFNPSTRLWSMYWTDTISATLQSPMVGSFDGAIGRFYDRDTFEGRDIIVQFLWDKTDVENPI